MVEQVKNYVENNTGLNTLFVLKGFSVTLFDIEPSHLQTIISNKIARLFQLSQMERPIIVFDEFICLYDIVLMQFKKIHIIENPFYQNLFPIETQIDKLVSDALLAHFDEDADEKTMTDELEEYTNIYSKYIQTNSGIACCYNITENQLLNEKIEVYQVLLPAKPIQSSGNISEHPIHVNVCNDADYYEVVQQLYYTNHTFAITWDHYIAGKSVIEKSLYKMNAYFPNRISKAFVSGGGGEKIDDTEIRAIMKRYWKYDDFRDLAIYDLKAVSRKQKEVHWISQGQIISDLVHQAEKCIRGEDFHDVFVTAPTGAGKSLMFQLPAIYLAEKYNLVTLIISPLIGLMNDQVQALERINYPYAKTINSDISPVIKQEILEDVKTGNCHILYLSPESLLARSDIEQLIGSRRIGMVIIDEAHIVTTWGKQFRPDYWFLGDHVQKIFRTQLKKDINAHGFVIATFTATAIYEGIEDMYHETLNSLHMNDPITYLGYVKRQNIRIDVSSVEKKNKAEYELNKFDALIDMMTTALMRGQKTLIYFPTVALITRFYEYCNSKNLGKYVTRYHGQLISDERSENFHEFLEGTKLIMLATKAFGMGIDISDIAIVAHFAPTGNVCDYMQEIGRAARDSKIDGLAIYKHMGNDFKHINRLHGLSTIKKYQLVRVIEKILDIFQHSLQNKAHMQTKRRNEMLIDAESFAYIFESPSSNSGENELINKVKTALLLIQKDYENRIGYSPFTMRPIPIFKNGYFAIVPKEQEMINREYPFSVKCVFQPLNICEVDLNKIWDQFYKDRRDGMSFPKFKYLLYTKNRNLDISQKYKLSPAMEVRVFLSTMHEQIYDDFIRTFKRLLNNNARTGVYISIDDIISEAKRALYVNSFQAEVLVNVLLAAIDIFQRDYSGRFNARIYRIREAPSTGKCSYSFHASVRDFFAWLDKGYKFIKNNIIDERLYVVNEDVQNNCKEILIISGVLETAGVLRFRSLGGSQSQIYIYINTTRTLREVRDKPHSYRNYLLELIEKRHADSVKMLSFLFQSGFSSEDIWDHLENYFLGIVPEDLLEFQKQDSSKKKRGVSMFTAWNDH